MNAQDRLQDYIGKELKNFRNDCEVLGLIPREGMLEISARTEYERERSLGLLVRSCCIVGTLRAYRESYGEDLWIKEHLKEAGYRSIADVENENRMIKKVIELCWVEDGN